jgi:hypothetical protein
LWIIRSVVDDQVGEGAVGDGTVDEAFAAASVAHAAGSPSRVCMVEIDTSACCDSASMRSTASWRASWAFVACNVTGSSPSGARVAVQARGGPLVVHEHTPQLVVTERVGLVD